jgi:hypothetical protein
MKMRLLSLLSLSLLLGVSSTLLVAQEQTALPLPPAGPNRPRGVPADYVITPFGYFHPSCVLQLKKGESFLEGGVLRHADGSTETVPFCPYPHYWPSGELAPTGSLEAKKTAVEQETGTTPPPVVNGWVESSNCFLPFNCAPGVASFGKVVSTWTVPPLPLVQDGQTVYFYPGLEGNGSDILQPVLGTIAAQPWAFASWHCCPANTADTSPWISVNPGDTLVGTIEMTCAAGTTACSTWNVVSEDQTTNQTTELSATPIVGETLGWAFEGVMEAYGILQCADYPPNASLTMNTLTYDNNLNLLSSVVWSNGWDTMTPPICNYDVTTTATNTGATNTTLTYGTTGPSFYLTRMPVGISVNQENSTNWTFNVVPVNGFSGPVSFSATNLPSGVTAEFAQGSSPNTYTLTLSATSAAPLTGDNQPPALDIFGSASGVATQNFSPTLYVNPALTGGSGTVVDLSNAYNAYAFYDDADRSDMTDVNSIDGINGLVYSANQLSPPGTPPMGLNFNGTQFTFGPPNQPDSVYGTGANSIELPSGEFAALKILATGVNGAQESQTLTVTYTDGTIQEFTQTFDDWHGSNSCTSSNPCAPGESVAVVTPYVDDEGGWWALPFYLFAYSFALNSSKTVQSLTLPDNRYVVVLAATLTLPPTATPELSPPSGTYSSAQSVTISDSTPGASIYYTTDGSTPTTSSTQYTAPITVSSTETIQAIATASGYSTSAVASATYTIVFPVAVVAPASLTFGSQTTGTTSAAQTVTLSNTGSAALAVASVSITGDFSQTNNCGSSVAVGDSCTISVTFTPTAAGARTGTLTVTDNSNGAAGSTQTVSLTGTGTTPAPLAGISPASLTFASTMVNSSTSSQAVTLSNTGTAALSVAGITASANFAQTNNCGSSVAAGSSCTINVTFSPTKGGSLTGTLTITDNSDNTTGSTQIVAVSGTGQDFTVGAASGSSTSATVAPGSSATYSLSVGAEGGMSGTVSFSCAGAPSESTCTVSPSSATPGNNVTVSVSTTAPSANMPRSLRPPRLPGPLAVLALALLLASVAWAVRAWREVEPSRRRRVFVPLAAGLLLAVALVGCGGGGSSSSGPPPNQGTPAGTYNLTVTGTVGSGAAAVSHSLTLTLTVS